MNHISLRKLFSAFLIFFLFLFLQTISGIFAPIKLTLTPPYFKTQEVRAAGESWYNSSWPYRKAITITGSTAGAQTNYQVKVDITYNANMKSDFSDIRFTDSDGTTLLNHWIESYTTSTSASFWVKIPNIPASPSTTTIYEYYGNASVASASSGNNTFDFFDDFNSWSLNPVLQPLQTWESGYTNRWGTIAYLNGAYYIYFANGPGSSSSIGRATSTDLITWVKDGSNPIISNAIGPSLLKNLDGQTPILYGGKYYMTTINGGGGRIQIRSASDINSNTWILENDTAVVPTVSTWYSSIVYSNSFVQEGSTYYIFFQGYDGTTWKIGYATASAPAGPYTVQGTLLEPSLGWEGSLVVDPQLRKFGSTYYLFYTGNGMSSCYNSYATSTSLTGTYTKSNILITPKGLSYPEILFNSNDSYYYLLGDDLGGGKTGKNLYRRADLDGAFYDGSFSDGINWTFTTSASVSGNFLSLPAGSSDEYLKSTSTFGLNTALRTKASFATYGNYLQIGYNNNTGSLTSNNVGFFAYNTPTVKAISGAVGVDTATVLGNQGTVYHTWEITRKSGQNKFYKDGTALATQSANIVTSSLPIMLENTNTSSGELDVDWTVIRNFVSPEPTLGILGSEESLDHFVVSGSATQTAGTSQTITITAKTNLGNTYTAYTGDKSLTFSGANAYSGGSNPTCSDKTNADIPFGTATTSTFTNGIATCTLKLYKVESASITATDGTYNANSNYLAVTVTDTTPPSAFTLSSPANNSSTSSAQPTLSWNASSDAESGLAKYQLYIDGSLNRDNISSSSASTTPVSALSDGNHTWYIVAVDAAGNTTQSTSTWTIKVDTAVSTGSSSSPSSTSSSTSAPICSDQAPGAKAPWLYGAITQDSGSVLLYFTQADNPVNKYVLEYGTKSGDYPYGVQDMGVNSRGQMTFLVKSLSPNTTYYFKVRGGNGCAAGSWSNEISAKTKGLISFNQLDITQSELESKPVEETPPTTTTCQTYTVKSGDGLWSIAENSLGDGNRYKEIIEQNKDKYPSLQTSNNLEAGWELKFNCGKQTTSETQNTPATQAQGGYDVKIKVVDTNKKPVEGAKVTIHSKVQETVTNKDGIAQFKNVEAGDHKVLIAYNNFEGEQSVNLTGNVKEFDLNVTVQQKAISLSPLAYGIIGIMGLVVIGLAVLLIKSKRKV